MRPARQSRSVELLVAAGALLAAALLLCGDARAALGPWPGGESLGRLPRLDVEGDVIGVRVTDLAPDREGRPAVHRGRLRGGALSPVMTGDGVLFRVRDEDAVSVSLVGDFNGWNELATPMRRSRHDVWRTTVDLGDGDWAYLFVIDGEWVDDPDNPALVPATDDEGESLGEASLLRIQRDEIVVPREAGFREAEGELVAAYDRVDQATLGARLGYSNRAELHPELSIGASRSLGRGRWLYEVDVAQPLFDLDVLDLGASAYRRTDTPDRERMGDLENSLATFFFREDWRDYHEAEGIALRSVLYVGDRNDLTVRWKDEDHRSVAKTTDWGLFGGEKRMRVNPAVDEGTLRSILTEWTLDTRNSRENPTRGVLATGGWEWAGGGLGGDFEFRRGTVDLRQYRKLSPGYHLDLRLGGGRIDEARRGDDAGGTTTGFDAIPVQERFYVGGVGTMRATQFKSIAGDRMLLANAEMRVDVGSDLQVAVFTDLGDAWIAADRDARIHTDAGVGFQDADGSFRVNVAKKIDRDDDGIWVTARIRRMF